MKRDRQDELAMDRANAEAVARERVRDRAIGEDAVRFGAGRRPRARRRAPPTRSPRRCAPTDSRRRRSRSATRHSSATHRRHCGVCMSTRRLTRDVEAAIGKLERMRVAGQKADRHAFLGGAPPGDGQHLVRGVDARDAARRRAPAAARRGRCRCRRRGWRGRESARSGWRARAPASLATRSPIGPPNRRASNVRAVSGSA